MLIEAKLKQAKMSWKNAAQEKKNWYWNNYLLLNTKYPEMLLSFVKIKELLNKFTADQLPSYAQAFYRNLDQITDEDLKSFYSDLKKLEHLKEQLKMKTLNSLADNPDKLSARLKVEK